MAIDVYPDVEKSFRDWLRAQPEINAVVGTRVFSGIPQDPTEAGTFPCITLQRIGGNDDQSDVPMDNALVQFDAWGSIEAGGRGHPIKQSAENIRKVLRGLFHAVQDTTLAPGVICAGMHVISDIWIPEPNSRRPRYVVTSLAYCYSV